MELLSTKQNGWKRNYYPLNKMAKDPLRKWAISDLTEISTTVIFRFMHLVCKKKYKFKSVQSLEFWLADLPLIGQFLILD